MSKRAVFASSILCILAAACSGDSQNGEPTITATSQTGGVEATPSLSLTPRAGLKPDLDQARALEAEGNIEEAAEIAIAAAAQNATRSEGMLTAARLLLELDRPADVVVLLEPLVADVQGNDQAGIYMLARALTALDRPQEALQQYDRYIRTGRPALPYAYLDRARNLLTLNRPLEAAESAQAGLELGVPGFAETPFLGVVAQAYERAGSFPEAIAAYEELLDRDGAFALARIAAIKRELGDPTAGDALTELLGSYPSSATAWDEMTKALDRGEQLPDVLVGLVHYRHNEYTLAQPYFQAQIDAAPGSLETAEAYYYLGAILESRGEIEAALANYALATAANPDSLIADDAIWWRGRIAQDQGQLAEAQELYARLVAEYPESSWAADAVFRRGMIDYVNDNYLEAAAIWEEGALEALDTLQQQRMAFWQAKSLLQAGETHAGQALLATLSTDHEKDFYGIRALDLLAGRHEHPLHERESSVDLTPAFDWAEAERWLSQKTAQAVSDAAWRADPRWLRAQELWLVGRNSQGDGEALDLMESKSSDPVAMYTMSRQLQAAGRISMAGRAGQRLIGALDTSPSQGLPKALLSLAYPAAFAAPTDRYAGDEDVSPLLLLAFVRQESFFDPRAQSPAGALGLTQVLPDTGASIAADLGYTAYAPSQLLHADLNLRFGANYMAQQVTGFDNEIFVALAAYNAGPSAAARWRGANDADDADIYLETVEFAETRLYIEIVAENYAIYRYLYGGESKPTLP